MQGLNVQGVQLDYPGRPGVLRGVTLRVEPGQLIVLRGRSGSGKTSLLNVAAGLQPPTLGRVSVGGERLDGVSDAQRAQIRARHVGLVLQHLHLLGELTLLENVELPMRLAGTPRPARRQRAQALLQTFGLAALARAKPHQCSGGEQQRAAIARALALSPAVLLVDEPTSALDAANAKQVGLALQEAARQGAAVVVATHDELLQRIGRRADLNDGLLIWA